MRTCTLHGQGDATVCFLLFRRGVAYGLGSQAGLVSSAKAFYQF